MSTMWREMNSMTCCDYWEIVYVCVCVCVCVLGKTYLEGGWGVGVGNNLGNLVEDGCI
jgi:hypothetical protein